MRLQLAIIGCLLGLGLSGLFFFEGLLTLTKAAALAAVLCFAITSIAGPWGAKTSGIRWVQLALIPLYLFVIARFFGLL